MKLHEGEIFILYSNGFTGCLSDFLLAQTFKPLSPER